jgi:adenylate cyclase
VAGGIGTVDGLKITVFGPVVNLASRLEGMTKILRTPILIDESTARYVRQKLPRELGRCRRLAVVRPYGLDTSLEVSELLPPESEYPDLTDAHLQAYEGALDAFLAGRWSESLQLLRQVPASDRVTDFLTVFIAQHNRTPPPGWDGVIPLSTKG